MIGVIDSGVADGPRVVAASRFAPGDDGTIVRGPVHADRIGHGSSIAATILASAAHASLVSAQVFHDSMTTSPATVAAALEWLVAQGARVVNMSFGLARDREILRDACAGARSAGVILVGASPARGPQVFPAAYAGVIRASGDARCAAGEISALEAENLLFGACPRTLDDRVRGASAAAAHVTGLLASWVYQHRDAGFETAVQHLRAVARHHGRESHRPLRE